MIERIKELSEILKIKINEREKAQKFLRRIEVDIKKVKKEIEKLELDLKKEANFTSVAYIQLYNNFYKKIALKIEALKSRLYQLENDKRRVLNFLKEKLKEEEKFKFLLEEEVFKYKKFLLKKEEKELAEVSIILWERKRGGKS